MNQTLLEEEGLPSPASALPADFRVMTGPMETYGVLDVASGQVTELVPNEQGQRVYPHLKDLLALSKSEDGLDALQQLPRPVVHMVGSSSEQDLQGDIMYPSALKDMTQVPPDLSIWLNHSYTLPQDLYGSLQGSPWLVPAGKITDLHLQSDVEVLNPAAITTYLYTLRGRKMGVSGGFLVQEAEWIDRKTGEPVDEDAIDFFDVMAGAVSLGIKHVRPVEWSTVGIPANQRSWVEGAVKGLFLRTGNKHLAPIVRELYPTKYLEFLGKMQTGNRAELETIAPRKSAATRARLYWLPLQKQFMLDSGDERRVVSGDEIEGLLQAAATLPAPEEVTKTASEEDKQAQEARAKKYGIGIKEGGNVTKPGEWADVPDEQWGDPVNYRYPLHDKTHTDTSKARFADPDNRKQYSSEEQAIIEKRIESRQRHFGEEPEKEEKALESAVTKAIAEDGSHPPVEADTTHEHDHHTYGDQGGDNQHKHPHFHAQGTANHQHEHAAEKAVASDQTATLPDEHTGAAPVPQQRAAPPVETAALPDGEREAFIRMYNFAASKLGLPDYKIACGLVPDAASAQQVISLVSQADTLADSLEETIDALMGMLRIPDLDEDEDEADEAAGSALPASMAYAVAGLVTRAGRRHSAADQQAIQAIHDLACQAGAMCDAGADEAGEDGSEGQMALSGESDLQQARNTLEGKGLTPDLSLLQQTLANLPVADIQARIAEAEARVAETLKRLAAQETKLAEQETRQTRLADDVSQTQAALTTIKGTPLGRPIPQTARKQVEGWGIATEAEMAAAIAAQHSGSVEGVLAQTTTEYVAGVGLCRRWPAGVGPRKELRNDQKVLMAGLPRGLDGWKDYAEGREALVPIISDDD